MGVKYFPASGCLQSVLQLCGSLDAAVHWVVPDHSLSPVILYVKSQQVLPLCDFTESERQYLLLDFDWC